MSSEEKEQRTARADDIYYSIVFNPYSLSLCSANECNERRSVHYILLVSADTQPRFVSAASICVVALMPVTRCGFLFSVARVVSSRRTNHVIRYVRVGEMRAGPFWSRCRG